MSESSAAKLIDFLATDWYLAVVFLVLVVIMGILGGGTSIGGNGGSGDWDGDGGSGGDGGGGD